MVKVGIVGAGRIGRVHITSIATRVPDARIKTVQILLSPGKQKSGRKPWEWNIQQRIIMKL